MERFNKKKLFEELSSRYKETDIEYIKKLKRYDKVVQRAKVIVDLIYGDRKMNVSKNEAIKTFVEEYYTYHGSIISSFRNYKSRSVEENFERAKQLRTRDRFKNFLDLFGEQKFTFNEEEKTLNEWMKEYLKGHISSKDFYWIVQWWQGINVDYMNEFYRKLDANAIISEQFSSGNLH